MVAESVSKRRTFTRSRRGCKTCRIRHVKCDETYPVCKKCTSTGRNCDGCSPPAAAWEIVTLSSISPTRSPERTTSPAKYDGRSQASFEFFQHRTVDYLAGLLDHRWKALLLRAAEQNEAIFHAAVAMGSMHKTVMSKQFLGTDFEDDIYAVRQYTRALRILASRPDEDQVASLDVMLTACILFTGFEILRRNPRVVLEHVRNGVSIVQENHDDMLRSQEKTLLPLQQLIPAFARLERQLHEMTGNNSPLIQAFAINQTAGGFFEYASLNPQPVPEFSSLSDAWSSLHKRWHAMISFTGGIHQDWFNHLGDADRNYRPPYACTRDQRVLELKRDFQIWSLGLEDLKSRLVKMTPRDSSILALLECYALQAETILGTSSLTSMVMLWDEYQEQFERMVSLCRTVIENEIYENGESGTTYSVPVVVQHRYSPNNEQQDASNPLTFDLSICMALFHVITKCRDARIRLEAIKLLEDYPRLEGLWDSAIIAKIGRAIDSGERQGASLEDAAARGASAAEIIQSQRVLHVRGIPSKNERNGSLILLKAKGGSGDDVVPLFSSFDW